MTRLFNYFALVVMGALICGCAEEVEDLQPAANGTVTMKTTVSLSENASTRALTEAGVKTFTAGDQIAVVYEQASGTAKALSVALTDDDITNSGKDAAFTVTLSSPKANGKVRYIYPASRAATPIATDVAPDNAATINYAALNTQDGTFASLASNLDFATFDGEMTAQGNLPKTASLVNPLTIGKFTIQNSDGTRDLTSSITGLSINDGTNIYAVTRTADEGPIYVAMKPITSSQTVVVNATDNTYYYTKSVSGQTLAANNIYDIKVKTTRGVDLSALTTDYIAQNDDVLMGTLDATHYPVKISIAAGATVTLNGVNIIGIHEDDDAHKHAGITCLGDATIILADGTENTVKGFHQHFPGVFVPSGNTLTIKGGTSGTGKLIASSNGDGAGIGGGSSTAIPNCGNIVIQGGVIEATGGNNCAGIGGGLETICGNITISGGKITANGGHSAAAIGSGKLKSCGAISLSGCKVTANGGAYAAGIGSGSNGSFSSINITSDIFMIIATVSNDHGTRPIGKGYADTTSGAVTIDGKNLAVGTPTANIDFTVLENGWKLSYNVHSVSNVVPTDRGKLIGVDGKIYLTAAQASAAGTTAVAMITYVGAWTGESSPYNHGLALALSDANGGSCCYWKTSNTDAGHTKQPSAGFSAFSPESGLQYNATHNTDEYPAFKAAISNNSTAAPSNCSAWFLPTGYQWNQMINAAGSANQLRDCFSSVGGTNMQSSATAKYWLSTEDSSDNAWVYTFNANMFGQGSKLSNCYVRSALAF